MSVIFLQKLCVVSSAKPSREFWKQLPLTSSPLRPHFFTGLLGPMLCSENIIFGVGRRMAAEGPYQEDLGKRNPDSLPTKHRHPLESKGSSLPRTGEIFRLSKGLRFLSALCYFRLRVLRLLQRGDGSHGSLQQRSQGCELHHCFVRLSLQVSRAWLWPRALLSLGWQGFLPPLDQNRTRPGSFCLLAISDTDQSETWLYHCYNVPVQTQAMAAHHSSERNQLLGWGCRGTLEVRGPGDTRGLGP